MREEVQRPCVHAGMDGAACIIERRNTDKTNHVLIGIQRHDRCNDGWLSSEVLMQTKDAPSIQPSRRRSPAHVAFPTVLGGSHNSTPARASKGTT